MLQGTQCLVTNAFGHGLRSSWGGGGAYALAGLVRDDLVEITARMEIEGTVREVLICSAYLPYNPVHRPPTKELEELVEFCKRRDLPQVVECNSNSYQTWGRTDTNARGRPFWNFLGGPICWSSTEAINLLSRIG